MMLKKENKEEEVIQKAIKIFASHGYANTTLRQLEREMGMNPASLHASFGGKKGVYLRALAQYRSYLQNHYLKDLLNSKGRLEDIKVFLIHFSQSIKSGKTPHGCFMANAAKTLAVKDIELRVQLQVFFDLLKEAFTEVLIKAQHHNELSVNADVERYANYLICVTEGLAVSSKVLEESQLDDVIDLTMRTIE